MRILDSKPESGIMGRKHKLRKQSRENVVRVSDTSDDGAVGGEKVAFNLFILVSLHELYIFLLCYGYVM